MDVAVGGEVHLVLHEQVLEGLLQLPGVSAVTLRDRQIMSLSNSTTSVHVGKHQHHNSAVSLPRCVCHLIMRLQADQCECEGEVAHGWGDEGAVEAGNDPRRHAAVDRRQVRGDKGVLVGTRQEVDLRAELHEVDGPVVEAVVLAPCTGNITVVGLL